MSARSITGEDIPAVVRMAKEFCGEMGYPFDASSLASFLRSAIRNGWCAVIAENDGVPVGFCGAMVAPNYTDFSRTKVTEFAWHTLPSLPVVARAKTMFLLLEEMEKFANARHLPLSVSTSVKFPSLGRMLEGKGFAQVESVFSKEIQNGY